MTAERMDPLEIESTHSEQDQEDREDRQDREVTNTEQTIPNPPQRNLGTTLRRSQKGAQTAFIPFTPKTSLIILLTACHIILMILIRRMW